MSTAPLLPSCTAMQVAPRLGYTGAGSDVIDSLAWTRVLPVSLQTHLPTAPLTAPEAAALVSEAPPLPEAVEAAFVTPGGSAQETSELRAAEDEPLPTAASVKAEQRPEKAGALQQRQSEPAPQTPLQVKWNSHGRAAAAADVQSEDDFVDSVSSVTLPPDAGTQQLVPAVDGSATAATHVELPLPPDMTGRINCTASGFCR